MRTPPSPEYLARVQAAEQARAAFIRELGLAPCRWSAHNLSRLLRSTGERPERVIHMRAILGELGMGHVPQFCYGAGRHYTPQPSKGGVFDHGEMFARDGHPTVIVGHPYSIDPEERELLSALARTFPPLSIAVDDRPSYYGFGTHHIRIELRRRRSPYRLPRATRKTRAFARVARAALADALT